jgi:excisionase family DNA binding protein
VFQECYDLGKGCQSSRSGVDPLMETRRLRKPRKTKASEQLTPPFYTVTDLARLLQLKPMTIYRMVKAGTLPYYLLGRGMRFRREEVEAFLQEHRTPTRRKEE